MSSDVVNKAQRYSPGHSALHATSTNSQHSYKRHQGGRFLVPEQHHVEIKSAVVVRQQPNGAVPSNFLNGGQLDFRVERGIIDLLTHCYLQFEVANNTGASATIAPIQLCIDRIEIFSGNGSKLLTTIHGQELFLSNAFLSRNEFEQLDELLGLTNTGNYATTGDAIADGATKVYYLPILNMFPSSKLCLSALNSELLIRVYSQSASKTVLTGAVPSINNVALLLKGFHEIPEMKQARQAVYNSQLPLVIPYANWQRMSVNLSLAVNTEYSIVLSGCLDLLALSFSHLGQVQLLLLTKLIMF